MMTTAPYTIGAIDQPSPRITTEAFWNRFTANELVSYDVAMQHNPADTAPAQRAAAKLRIFQRSADQTGFRNLARAPTQAFLTALEAAGIIAAGRAAVIGALPLGADETFVAP